MTPPSWDDDCYGFKFSKSEKIKGGI